MRTDLVLDDKGKAFRFRSFLQKQAGGGGSDNGKKEGFDTPPPHSSAT